ncbi:MULTISPECIES: pentapeptide repeat-containing protein [unclassified Pseudoclavibacter]|uniref:pentapeptide repeat-containing protein n=1 Tax=unclassified Pseudoclavibacter TaxID=2615177 RepID=UPI001BADF12E|nr:pentapeptide repeat-containing protein [Pseudoclavibacter sp. Marseille-Q4354]MBS3180023.1 pentapeptide repeat-containing protein [Pseudoclavibacter sp. Marseille-Q4354]
MQKQQIGWTKTEKIAWPLAIAAYVGIAVWAIIVAPDWLVATSLFRPPLEGAEAGAASAAPELTEAERLTAVSAARQSVLLASGGGLALITLIVTISRDAITRARADRESDEQMSAQFTAAINQLGETGSQSIRLGGIHGLERTANAASGYHFPVLAVLAQFIREHSRAANAEGDEATVPGDVETAAEVLARLTDAEASSQALSLADTNLRGVHLRNADFSGWNCQRFDAYRADLGGSRLEDTLFHDASLDRTRLSGAHLNGARLSRASLVRASLHGADLTGATLHNANLSDATLRRATLLGTNLDGARLHNATLQEAHIAEASFDGADLRGCNFHGVTGWTSAQFERGVLFDEDTIWPSGYVRPEDVRD